MLLQQFTLFPVAVSAKMVVEIDLDVLKLAIRCRILRRKNPDRFTIFLLNEIDRVWNGFLQQLMSTSKIMPVFGPMTKPLYFWPNYSNLILFCQSFV